MKDGNVQAILKGDSKGPLKWKIIYVNKIIYKSYDMK